MVDVVSVDFSRDVFGYVFMRVDDDGFVGDGGGLGRVDCGVGGVRERYAVLGEGDWGGGVLDEVFWMCAGSRSIGLEIVQLLAFWRWWERLLEGLSFDVRFARALLCSLPIQTAISRWYSSCRYRCPRHFIAPSRAARS